MINSVIKATAILNVVSDNKNIPISLGEISKKTGFNKATCSHIVSTLLSENYLKRISHTEGYLIGPAAHCLSRFGKYEDELVDLCHPILKWLNKKTGFSTVLAIVAGGKKFIIDYIDPQKMLSVNNGSILPDDVYRTATGRAILFNMTRSQLIDFFKKVGAPCENHWAEVNTVDDILALAKKRQKHDIVVTENFSEDIHYYGYGAPIYKNRECIGAIGLFADYPINSKETLDDALIKASLLKAQREANHRLDFS